MDSSKQEEVGSQTPTAAKPRSHFLFFGTIFLFFSACFSASLYFDWRMEQKMQAEQEMLRAKEEAASVRREITQLSEDLEAYYKIFEQKVCARRDLFLKLIPLKDAEWEFKRARVGVNRIASKWGLCNWGVCVSLAYKIAVDKVKKTHKFEEAVEPYLTERLIDPLQEGVFAYQKAFEAYRKDIAALCKDFSFNCAFRCQMFLWMKEMSKSDDVILAKRLGTDFAVAEDKIKDMVQARIHALGEFVFDLGMIKEDCSKVRILAYRMFLPFLSKSVGRVSKSFFVGKSIARVDGPLKFLDVAGGVVAVGGAVWTSYEVYSAIETMPGKFHEQLDSIIDQMETTLEEYVTVQAGQLADSVLKCSKDEMSSFHKSLKEEIGK